MCHSGVPGQAVALSFRVPSHVYRKRHGTFYFRHIIFSHLRAAAGRGVVRFSLGTEQRQPGRTLPKKTRPLNENPAPPIGTLRVPPSFCSTYKHSVLSVPVLHRSLSTGISGHYHRNTHIECKNAPVHHYLQVRISDAPPVLTDVEYRSAVCSPEKRCFKLVRLTINSVR